jgi:hypothetical protein
MSFSRRTGLGVSFSVLQGEVKAFLFVQINLDVARREKNSRVMILKIKIRKNANVVPTGQRLGADRTKTCASKAR